MSSANNMEQCLLTIKSSDVLFLNSTTWSPEGVSDDEKRCIPDSVRYTALVHAYGKARNWEVAHVLLIEIFG